METHSIRTVAGSECSTPDLGYFARIDQFHRVQVLQWGYLHCDLPSSLGVVAPKKANSFRKIVDSYFPSVLCKSF